MICGLVKHSCAFFALVRQKQHNIETNLKKNETFENEKPSQNIVLQGFVGSLK